MTTADERSGTVVADRFRLEERLDTGGLGTVWRATDRERDVPVALKCEHDDAHDREQVRAHFRGELGWFRRFDGGPVPGSLVRFVDGAAGGERAYIATELVGGGSVADRSDRGTLEPSLETVRELGGPVCRALGFLHRNGVAHLDLTPSNVLVRQSGRPAVIDLNAAVSTDSDPDVSFRRDPFKSPELTRGVASDAPIGPRSDVYALGAFLAFLASGTASTETASSVDEWDPIDLEARGTAAPAALAEPIRRATAPDPDDRFADADALYDALVSFLEAPDRSAHLVHESTGHVVRVRPGDTLGRWSPDDPVPTVVLPDDERFCCPEHATLAVVDGDGDNADSDSDDDTDSDADDDTDSDADDGATWRLRDRSLNGTYVRKGSDWKYVLSRHGLERRRDADAPVPASEPPPSIPLSDGDCIAPVNPDYGCRLVFRTGTGSQN